MLKSKVDPHAVRANGFRHSLCNISPIISTFILQPTNNVTCFPLNRENVVSVLRNLGLRSLSVNTMSMPDIAIVAIII